MPDNKHTPGPWRSELQGDGNFFAVIGGGAKLSTTIRIIAEVTVSDLQSEADAHLIAAAPDMLEALKALLPSLYNPFEPDNQSAHYKRVEAAIAKARGSQ